ncbi:MAG: hypothetical protein L6V84_01645 [Oscillospiraceae bacterium]|nr:MAG: hypothetical protein L6V84_01645 [Oscillospiraceae bacterium]
MEQYTFRTDEFREPPFESRQIHPFCELPPDALPRLNQSLGLDMSVAVFAAIQAVYRERELREPLVGEVRLLATLHSLTASDAARVGVGEVCTDSDAVAETWADLMARRRLLAGGVPAPLHPAGDSDRDGQLPAPSGERPADAPVRVLAEDAACPAAAGARALADGYVPVARFVAGDTARLVCIRRQEDASFRAERAARFASDDLILLARDLPDRAVSAFFSVPARIRTTGERMTNIVALSGRPLPLAAAALCPDGAHIQTDVVCPTCTGDIMAEFTRVGTGAEDAVRPAYLLRLRRTDLSAFWTFCREMNLPVSPIVIGQAFSDRHLSLLNRGHLLAHCGIETLGTTVGICLYGVRPDAAQSGGAETAPIEAEVPAPTVLSLPGGVLAAETSVTLTAGTDADLMPAASRQSAQAVRAVLSALTEAGADPAAVSLSVALRGIRLGQRDAEGTRLPDVAFGGLCGLYRACAELRLPAPDPCLTPARTAGEVCRLSVLHLGIGCQCTMHRTSRLKENTNSERNCPARSRA